MFASGGHGKVKLLCAHESRPWVVYFSDEDNSVRVVDLVSKSVLMHKTLRSIVDAIPSSTSSAAATIMSSDAELVMEILFPGAHDEAASADEAEVAAFHAELGEVRHLSFTDGSFSQPTLSSVHASGFVLIHTAHVILLYNFLTNTTLFLSNSGQLQYRGRKLLGLAASRYNSSSGSSKGASHARSGDSSVFSPLCCAFVEAGVLAVGCSDGTIRIWRLVTDLNSCKETARWQAYKGDVVALHRLAQPFTSSDQTTVLLASVGADGAGYIWSASGSSSSGGDLSWHSLMDEGVAGAGGAGSSPVAPVARFSCPQAPSPSSPLCYSCATGVLSIILADKTMYSLSVAPLLAAAASTVGSEGRSRTSTAGSSDHVSSAASNVRKSVSEDSRSRSATSVSSGTHDGKAKKGILTNVFGAGSGGGSGGSSISKSFFSFMGASSGASAGPSFTEDDGWSPVELHSGVHGRHRQRALCAALGARGELLLATKGSPVVTVLAGSATVAAPLSAASEELSVREEWHVGKAVEKHLGLAEDDADSSATSATTSTATATGSAAPHASAATSATAAAAAEDKGLKVYAIAFGCDALVVLGTNKGVVAASYPTARHRSSPLASHFAWPFVLQAGVSAGAERICKLLLSPVVTSNSSSGGSSGGSNLPVVPVRSQLQGHCSLDATSDESAVALLVPSVSGRLCCALLAPRGDPASVCGYVVLNAETLHEEERGSCTSFAWVGAAERFVVATSSLSGDDGRLQQQSAQAAAAARGGKRNTILSSMKGLLGRDKTVKGGEVAVRACIVKAVRAAGLAAAFGALPSAQAADASSSFFSSTSASSAAANSAAQALNAATAAATSERVVSFSGPLVFLSANADPSAGRSAGHGAFYHCSSSLLDDGTCTLQPLSGLMPIPLDVQWTASSGSTSGEISIRALCAALMPTGAALVLGLGLREGNELVLSCLYNISLSSPASPLGVCPRLHWSLTPSTSSHSADLLHFLSSTASWVVPIPKQHPHGSQLPLALDGLYPLPVPLPWGEGSSRGATPTFAADGLVVYAASPPVAVRVGALHGVVALVACLHSGRTDEANTWATRLGACAGADTDRLLVHFETLFQFHQVHKKD